MDEKIKGNLGFINVVIPKLKPEQDLLLNKNKVPVSTAIIRYKMPKGRPKKNRRFSSQDEMMK